MTREKAEELAGGHDRGRKRKIKDTLRNMTDEELVEMLNRLGVEGDIVITDGYSKTEQYKEDW